MHLRGVSDYAVGRLDEDEAAALAELLGRFLDGEPAPVPSPAASSYRLRPTDVTVSG